MEWKTVPQFCGRGNEEKGILKLKDDSDERMGYELILGG